MIYEFECSKGHISEAYVPMGTEAWPCDVCIAEMKAIHAADRSTDVTFSGWNPIAKRIMSATKTNFVFADTGKRIKHVMKSAEKVQEIRRG